MKYSQFTAVSGRNVKSGLSHQTEQADRFQRNSFTAGVWSGDDQQCEVFPKCHGDRNNFFRIEQWVTSNGTNPPIDPALAARRARAAALVMLGLPGTAFVYQGEELGLPEDFDLTEDEIQDPNWERSGHYFKGRDGCRVPLPWQSDGPAFGFNATGASWLPQPAWFAQYATNRQIGDGASVLHLYCAAVALRKQWVANGTDFQFSWLTNEECPAPLLGWRLPSGMVVMANFSDSQPVALPQPMTVLLVSDATVQANTQVESVPPAATVWALPA